MYLLGNPLTHNAKSAVTQFHRHENLKYRSHINFTPNKQNLKRLTADANPLKKKTGKFTLMLSTLSFDWLDGCVTMLK